MWFSTVCCWVITLWFRFRTYLLVIRSISNECHRSPPLLRLIPWKSTLPPKILWRFLKCHQFRLNIWNYDFKRQFDLKISFVRQVRSPGWPWWVCVMTTKKLRSWRWTVSIPYYSHRDNTIMVHLHFVPLPKNCQKARIQFFIFAYCEWTSCPFKLHIIWLVLMTAEHTVKFHHGRCVVTLQKKTGTNLRCISKPVWSGLLSDSWLRGGRVVHGVNMHTSLFVIILTTG